MPGDDRLGPHNHQGGPPSRPKPREQHPEQTIRRTERRPRRASLHCGELLAQRKNFQLERYAAAEGVTESGEEEKGDRWHAGESIRRSAERPRILCGTRFSGGTGKAAAIAYTLIETAKLNDIDPQAWLALVLDRIPDYKINRVDELLPWNCAPIAHPTANT